METRREIIKRDLQKKAANKPQAIKEAPPPENFREIETIPTVNDIRTTEKPYLRKNKGHGKFENGEHYLDVQFRLLREDLVQPLREGIHEIINEVPKHEKKQALKLYYNIKIKYPRCTNNGLNYRISFNTTHTKDVPWKHSKRLIFGSLLCFSRDRFRTIVFATVADRKPEDLSNGLFGIRLVNGEDIEYFKTDQEVKMVESNTYFEAYRYVLQSMKSFTTDTIPMSKYIVDCNTNVNIPTYLQGGDASNYELKDSLNTPEDFPSKFNILDDKGWPTHEETELNDSQLKAFKHALTKEFVVIQGPPGTGKTHVGLKIAHALLENKRVKEPILIVCYTNHALDQFLNGLISLGHKNLIRVGGRCSEELKQYSIRNEAKRIMETGDLRRGGYHRSVNSNESEAQREELHQEIKRIRRAKHSPYLQRSDFIEIIDEYFSKARHVEKSFQVGSFIKFQTLQYYMPYKHLYHFQKYNARCAELKLHIFDVFLQLFKVDPDDIFYICESENDQENKAAEVDSEDDQNIDVTGEGDALEDRWVTDQNRFQPIKKDSQEEKDAKVTFYKDSQGFQYQKPSKKKRKKAFQAYYHKYEAMTEQEAKDVINPWQLNLEDRWRLYKFWLEEYSKVDVSAIQQKIQSYEDVCLQVAELERQEDSIVMKNVDIIAMTTSGAARLQDSLEKIKPKIVIVEEAAEVLEGHVLTSLTSSVQHLILIGDHFQLRPSPSVYRLAKSFDLDVSLFERMVNNGMQCHTLDIQHRMRPEISLYLHHIYPSLKDHYTVFDYPKVKGVGSNIMFINHNEREANVEFMKSKSNLHEATFLASLCLYFLQQGYKPSQITILSGYVGQVIQLRNLMPKDLYEGVRVTAVDNFQGEENDIILLSLVRSNEDEKIGFLSIENRICVSLSRAKQGLYIIGDFDLMEEKSSLWRKIIQEAKENAHFSDSLTLCCQNHPKAMIEAKKATDFNNAPEGGCLKPCAHRLDCGHVCERACHPTDAEHTEYVCKKKCYKKTCEDGHECQKKCHFGTECGKCLTLVPKIIPDCNHRELIECHQDPGTAKCSHDCEKLLECGHKCQGRCWQNCLQLKCLEFVKKKLLCGHFKDIPCYQDVTEAICNEQCKHILSCGHRCKGSCAECKLGRLHKRCKVKCDRVLICSHICKANCTKDCPPCEQKCENHCVHSHCRKKCGVSCSPCREDCSWKCRHKVCKKKCYEECDRSPCNVACALMLDCGHPCIGLCGEPCPSKCRICDTEEVEEIFFGTEQEKDARFIQLEDCGHIFELSGLDQWMKTELEEKSNFVKLKGCPKCGTIIRRSLRYGNIIKRTLQDIENIKKKIFNQNKDLVLEKEKAYKKCKDFNEVVYHMTKAKLSQYSMENTEKLDTFSTFEEFKCEKPSCSAGDMESYRLAYRLTLKSSGVDDTNRIYLQASYLEILFNLWAKYGTEISSRRQKSRIMRYVSELRDYIMDQYINEEQIKDVQTELSRIECHLAMLDVECKMNTRQSSKPSFAMDLENLKKEIEVFENGIKIKKEKIQNTLTELKALAKRHGLEELTLEERKMITTAMGLSKGHWYKCPKGHYYCIGECGGANQESKCPECKAIIGGTNHRLATGNQHAGEFDDSRFAAYSEEANNMFNFDLGQLEQLQL